MAAAQTSDVIQFLRRIALRNDAAKTDGELLTAFIDQRDETAFASLVRRHGPMVWSVCRRVLDNNQDAEDAFQAAFIILVRRAGSVIPRSMIANWLYGVAHQTALHARRTVGRRRLREKQVAALPEPKEVVQPGARHDLRTLLDRELSRLPDIYRAVLVLCDLEGKTREQAARQLGWPEGTVAGRLARARALLAKRLGKHGLPLTSASLAAHLLENGASATPPISLVHSTVEAAISFAMGQTAAAGLISAKAASLTQGVLNAMFLSKLKTFAVLLVMAGLLTTGGRLLSYSSAGPEVGTGGNAAQPSSQAPPSNDELEQAKARIEAAKANLEQAKAVVQQAQAELAAAEALYQLAQTDRNKVAARKAAVAKLMQEMKQALEQLEKTPSDKQTVEALNAIEKAVKEIKDQIASDQSSQKERQQADGFAWGKEVNGLQLGVGLLPGDEGVYGVGQDVQFSVKVRNVSKSAIKITHMTDAFESSLPRIVDENGKSVQILQPYVSLFPQPIENNLAPGDAIEIGTPHILLSGIEGKPAPDAPTIYVSPGKYRISYSGVIRSEPKLSTGEVTFEVNDQAIRLNWGKEINGLQLGVGLLNGKKGLYSANEEVQLVVKLRNLSKTAIKVSYSSDPLDDVWPQVLDSAGKRVQVVMALVAMFKRVLRERNIAPGEVIEIGTPRIALMREKPDLRVTVPSMQVAPGKYRISYAHFIQTEPMLSTGEVEIEVKANLSTVEAKEQESELIWGKEIKGLQLGVGLLNGKKDVLNPVEEVRLTVKLRNVSKTAINVTYGSDPFVDVPPQILDSAGKHAQVVMPLVARYYRVPIERNIAPGATIEIGTPSIRLMRGKPDLLVSVPAVQVSPGKYRISYAHFIHHEPMLSTGEFEIDVKAPAAP